MTLAVTASWAAKRPNGMGIAKRSARVETAAQRTIQAAVPISPIVELVRLHNEWGPLRFAELSHKVNERWIRVMFQGTLPAERTLSRFLELENLALKERIASIEKEKSILLQNEKQMADRLRGVEADYENLKTRSAGYLKLKEEYQSIKSALTVAREDTRFLAQENESLRISHRVRWLIIGILVFFSGWLVGMRMGRRRKKRPSSYHV